MSMEATSSQSQDNPESSRDIAIGIGVAIVSVVMGGVICALVVHRFGELGSIVFLLLGWLAGAAARKLMSRPRKVVGYCVAAAVISAMLIAEVAWIRWNIEDVESWGQAIGLLPTFFKEFQMTALVAVLFSLFGANSAYREAGVAYRLVRVVEE